MKGNYLKRKEFLLLSAVILIAIILVNSLASFLGGYMHYVFYQGGYGLILSLIVPLVYVFNYEKSNLKEVGFKKVTVRGIIIAIIFIAVSVGGQLKNNKVNMMPVEQIVYIMTSLIMTTFFEEFLFRGFLQTRYEKIFGAIPAIILSGLTFSLYHLGYPGFRNWQSLLTLFWVGMMFATAFKLSGNNLLIAFLVNLPNAVLTYLINPQKFVTLGLEAAIFSAITIIAGIIIFFVLKNKYSKNSYEKSV